MANTIILKKSSTASAVPGAGSLQPGELAVNLADAKLYTKTTGGTVILVGSGAGGGGSGTVTSVDVSGGTTGLTTSGGPVTSSGTITIAGTLALANGGTGATTDSGARTALGLATVAATGAYSDLSGQPTNVSSFTNDSGYLTTVTSGQVTTALGFTPYDAANPSGYITSSALTPYLTSATASTTYQPLDGDLTAIAGLAGTDGLIRKTAANTYTLDTATYLTGITSGDVTTALGFTPYDATNPSGYTTNTGTVTSVNLTAGTGVSVSGGPITSTGAITVTNTAPDQVVSLTGAGTTTISGTYPNFTVTSNDSTVGTVTSVGGTGTVSGLTLTGSVTSTGNLTLGGTLSLTSGDVTTALGFTPYDATNPSNYLSTVSLTSNVTGTLPIANGGTGATDAATALTNLGAYPSANPSGYTSNVGTVTSISGTGTVSGLTLTGTVTSAGNLTLGGAITGFFPLTGGDITGNLNASGNVGIGTVSPAEKLDVVGNIKWSGSTNENVFTITDGTVDLDPSNGTIQLWTLGASRSPTATGFDAGQSMTLMVDDGSAYTITWPSVTWKTDGGVAPTLNTTGYTVIQLWKVSTVLYGARVGDA